MYPAGAGNANQGGFRWPQFNPREVRQAIEIDTSSQPLSFPYLIEMINYESEIYDASILEASGRIIAAEISYALLAITHLVESIAYFFFSLLAQALAWVTPASELSEVKEWKDIAQDYGHYGARALGGFGVCGAQFLRIGV